MNITDYIWKKINEIVNSFSNIELRYAYDAETDFHIVEITGDADLQNNENFIHEKWTLYNDFANLFPNDDLIVTESNILTEDVPTTYIAQSEVFDTNRTCAKRQITNQKNDEYHYTTDFDNPFTSIFNTQITFLAA